jgi:hypothetical protein
LPLGDGLVWTVVDDEPGEELYGVWELPATVASDA